MIAYSTRWKHYVELWFDEPDPDADTDVDVLARRRALSRPGSGHCEAFYSLRIDLSKTPETIYEGFTRNTRAQIRRSVESDQLRFDFFDEPTAGQMAEFIAFYDAFAQSKGLDPMSPEYAEAHRLSGQCSLSRVRCDREDLVWHANVSYGPHVGMMFSASQLRLAAGDERKLIGRANRRLHWEELKRFRAQGRRYYDFGGWYEGHTDEERLSINRFKEEFGGSKVLLFAGLENRTFVAKLTAALKQRTESPRRDRIEISL